MDPRKKERPPETDPACTRKDEDLPEERREKERELDHGLKETFPASDPVSINPGAD